MDGMIHYLFGEHPGTLLADALATPRDESDLTFEFQIHFVLLPPASPAEVNPSLQPFIMPSSKGEGIPTEGLVLLKVACA
jgi:hypothetical protein